MLTIVALVLFAVVFGGMWLGLEATSLSSLDTLIERLLGKRRSQFGLVPVAAAPVAFDASEPKAKVVEVWMNRGWKSIQAQPSQKPLLLTWAKPDYAGMTAKALRSACKERGVKFTARMRKADLVAALV